MNISVFGLGYVGAVTAACLANEQNVVIGVDIKQDKVDSINCGSAPVYEKGLASLIKTAVEARRLRATTAEQDAVNNSEISLICVGTPTNQDGSLNIEQIGNVCSQLGNAVRNKGTYHTIVIRSTVLPGTTHGYIIPALEKATGGKCGTDFGVCVNPEFLREGQAIYDFFNPERTVIGEIDSRDGDLLEMMCTGINAPVLRVDISTSEMIKYVDNSFHALKVTFANEIGSICNKLGIDSHKVMDIFCMDKKLNLSPYYFKPGFAYGGSCLPKDLRALLCKSLELNLRLPLLDSVQRSNQAHIERAFEQIISFNRKSVGILGLSFKSGTSDTRESPALVLINMLSEKGYTVYIYDPVLTEDDLRNLPADVQSVILKSLDDVIKSADILVLTKSEEIFSSLPDLITKRHVIVDLVGAINKNPVNRGN